MAESCNSKPVIVGSNDTAIPILVHRKLTGCDTLSITSALSKTYQNEMTIPIMEQRPFPARASFRTLSRELRARLTASKHRAPRT